MLKNLKDLPYSYAPGCNPFDEDAYYNCDSCGFELVAEEVGFVVGGRHCANGEISICPNCGSENAVHRGVPN